MTSLMSSNVSSNASLETSTSAIDRQFWDYFEMADERHNITWEEVSGRQQGAVLSAYGVLMGVGALGNVVVLAALAGARRRRSRVDMLMTHLAVADVCVTCGVIPLEIGWKYTNAWLVGNLLCKVLLVMRAFGLYLSSNVLVCISIDRYVFGAPYSPVSARSITMSHCQLGLLNNIGTAFDREAREG
ncbi:jg2444 [Pararge aegeria aegeria]|uniref:Jg2444 protein n=1 Tax=Pararge aegeria aegeria TaxID=348720 RepID=A0A8S4RW87_9NEOP|nr:jg2444 [Pararge aegeria aegeria]